MRRALPLVALLALAAASGVAAYATAKTLAKPGSVAAARSDADAALQAILKLIADKFGEGE